MYTRIKKPKNSESRAIAHSIAQKKPRSIQMAALDLVCTATAKYGKNEYEADGQNGEKQDVEGRINQYGGLAGGAVFEGKKTKYDHKTMYECAEANAMANVLERYNRREGKLPRAIEISDATWTLTRGTHTVGDIEPRCKNCVQWVPNQKVLNWSKKAGDVNKNKKLLKKLKKNW